MKQKIVMQVQMNTEKCRSKAMKIAVTADGVTQVEIKGDSKNQLVVIGDGVDAVKLACCLRKKLQHATILTVEEEKEKKEEKPKEPTTVVWSPLSYYGTQMCEVTPYHETSPCSIL